MKNLLLLSVLVFNIFFFSSCEDITILDVASSLLSDSGSSSSSTPPVDETNLTLRPEFDWRVTNGKANLLLRNNTKLLSSTCTGLELRDVKTGDLDWEWDDIDYPSCLKLIDEKDYYIKDNVLLFFNVNRYYSIDLLTGKTIWKKDNFNQQGIDAKYYSMTGLDDLYFQIAPIELKNNRKQDAIFFGNIYTPDSMTMALAPNFKQDTSVNAYHGKFGEIWSIEAFRKINGDILLAISYGEAERDSIGIAWTYNTSYGVWNFTQKYWEYKDIFIWKDKTVYISNLAKLKIIKDKLYCYSESQLSCYDLNNGQLIWTKEKTRYDNTMELEFSEKHIFVSYTSNLQEMIDARTGKVIWAHSYPKARSFHQAVLTDNYLYKVYVDLKILDTSTGKLLETIETPYDDYPKESYFEYFGRARLKAFKKEEGKDQVVITTDKHMFGLSYGEE